MSTPGLLDCEGAERDFAEEMEKRYDYARRGRFAGLTRAGPYSSKTLHSLLLALQKGSGGLVAQE